MMKRICALLLCASLLMLPAFAADMAPPPDGMPGLMGEPPGGPGGPPGGGDAAPENAAIVITDGEENLEAEYDPGAYSRFLSQRAGMVVIDGLELRSEAYTFNGLSVSGPASQVRLENSNLRLAVGEPATDEQTGGAAANIDNGATLYISHSNLIVDGAARYVTANYNDGALIVNDSLIQSTGSNENTQAVSEPFSNAALLISGTARANFSIGATQTYYFNSTCTAEGWAALSTDSATGTGLDLYAYNTDGIAEHGGYGAYADTNCRVWLYGSRLTAAEIGAIISKSGRITLSPASAAEASLLRYNEGAEVEADSVITGGRNAVMIHAPDMMGQGVWAADCGYFAADHARIATDPDLVSTKDYYDYGEAVGAYIDYVSGSDILLRSTSAEILLTDVEMESYNNTLIHTVLNADSMGNFLASGDGGQVEPIAVTMTAMDVSGDVRHEDYQRRMTLALSDATLTGNIVSGTMALWNETWKDYGDVNWVVDSEYDSLYGVQLTMDGDSTWNVTGESTLRGLQIADGAVIRGEITLDGAPLQPEPDTLYEGDIRVTGDYVPEAPEEEMEEEPPEEASEAPAPEVTAAPSSAPQPTPAPSQTASPQPAAPTPASHRGVIVGVLAAVLAAAAIVCGLALRRRKRNK